MKKLKPDKLNQINEQEEANLVRTICKKYDEYENRRSTQLSDIKMVRNAIYDMDIPVRNDWNTLMTLPDIYELSQTLKSHISRNLYSHPEAMFDVSGTSPKTQNYANRQKAMLVNTFEQMNISEQIDKIIDSIVETGETTLFVGWETKFKQIRRACTFDEHLKDETGSSFKLEEKLVYDNAKIKHIKSEDFVFDQYNSDNWDRCTKIYRTYYTLDEITSDISNNLMTKTKYENLKGVIAKKRRTDDNRSVDDNKLEILEYWGDIELANGKLLKNMLIVTAGRCEIIRLEPNPFVINPFIHANIIENPHTGRGISPLRVALVINKISSAILNKQLDALSLMMNPPYLAPKGCFKGRQDVSPGKIIEYDAALMPQPPSPLNFDKAMVGWDFLNYFKTTMESATGIFKNMAGNIESDARTATELNYTANGQEARLNMILDAINRKVIVPMVEKTAEIIADFRLGNEIISINENGETKFLEVDDEIRKADYIYRYGDGKAVFERKNRLKELFDVLKSFSELPNVSERVNWLECFKFALEQYGIENAENFLTREEYQKEQNFENVKYKRQDITD